MATTEDIAGADTDTEAMDAQIGFRVHTLIWRQRRKQVEIARQLGITSSVLSKKLRGDSGWSAAQLVVTAQALGVSVGSLFGESTIAGPDGPDDGAALLPRLDSNQQPSGYWPPRRPARIPWSPKVVRERSLDQEAA